MSSSRSRLVAATTRTSTGNRCGAADGDRLPLLQHPQQFHLRGGRHLADFVQEERAAAAAAAKSPCLSRTAPVNEPFTWPNSSDSSRLSGQRAAVDGQERAINPGRQLVDGSAR